ncbi:MAG: HD domain-containing protein [Halobacteriales archaeon]
MGVEIKESPVSDSDFEAMKAFVFEYLEASVENESEGGRMRWYPWHSAEYRHNHILNVVDLATRIAEREGANVDTARVAALFHDIAKLDVDQDVHAERGAEVTRQYLENQADVPASFVDQVCRAIEEHNYQGDIEDLPLETQALIEADLLDKIGANGITLMLLRMGYEARTHLDAAEMVERVRKRGVDAAKRIRTDTGESLAHQRIKRVRWFSEWLQEEVRNMEVEEEEEEV